MKLLHVDSSINGANSVSRKLTKDTVAQWLSDNPGTHVDYLDLAEDTPSHFSRDAMGFRLPPSTETLTEAQRSENALSEALVSQFMAWIDRLAQAGRTFKYTENGPVGLASGKTVIAALSRGGIYSTSDAGQAMEHQETYLKTVFGFFGITDIRVVRAEGTDLGADSRANAFQTAQESIKALASRSFDPVAAEAV
jgi:FMN-dependent NADH-azoreductase